MIQLLGLPAMVLIVVFFTTPVHATQTVPYKMNFQGHLTDASGNAMANGTYNMKFRIYDALTGGTQQWAEQRANFTATGVTVTNGLFSVQLGDVTSLPVAIFATQNLYFEIELPTPATATCVGASCESYTEGPMGPRNKLGTSAYAFNSDTLDGLDSTAFGQLGANNSWTGTNTINAANASAFSVINGATALFTADTTNSQVKIGVSDTVGAILVLDTKTNAGDPTGVDGAMYYNSNLGKFRCYQASAWADCIAAGSTPSLQQAYDNSSSPATITTTAAKGVMIVAGAAPTASLFTVDNSANPTTTNNTNGVAINYAGGSATVEGAGLRVDYVPGGTSGGIWSGARIVANATGAASGVLSYGLKVEGPSVAGAGKDIGLAVASGFDIGLDIASGGIQLSTMTDPASPAAGNLRVYATDIAGRIILKQKSPLGLDTAYQPALFTTNVAMLLPNTGATVTALGMPNTAVGTISTPSITTTNMTSIMRKMRVTSAATANSASELRSALPLVARANIAGLGGFFYAVRFSINSTTLSQQLFSGLTATTTATGTSVSPSALANIVGVGWDSADTNLQIMTNDGSGFATKTDLGSNFPTNLTTAVYELIMFAPPSGTTIGYRVVRLDTGSVTSGTLSADLPQDTLALTHHQYMNNGGTAAAVVMDISRVYIESDY